ncbi:MAG: glycosyltransferase family 4 protein [Acidobacteriota bacterium]
MSLALARSPAEPWWWQFVDSDVLEYSVHYVLVVDPEGRPRSMLSRRFAAMSLGIVRALGRARRERDTFITTGECDWTSFVIAGVQTLFRMRRPRHVIVQFIMRERTASLGSRLKYAFMGWCFSSVDLCVCSARAECDYYARAFGWPRSKLAFVPFHTDPRFLDIPVQDGDYAVSAGRSFRDYDTLLDAWEGLDVPLWVVGYKGARPAPQNVTIKREIPLADLTTLIAGAGIVVVPLEERRISIGQSVILQAMAMGKAVVVTRVDGTVDYVEHMKTGLLVPPRDPAALREAVRLLSSDVTLRRRLAAAALEQIKTAHLVSHYMRGVSDALTQGTR